MSSASLLKRFEAEVELTPVVGASNVHLIQPKPQARTTAQEHKMSQADWDKFEADIDEAFEQLP